MKSLTKFLICLSVLALIFAFQGCKKDEGVVQPPDELAPPTALKALSMDGAVKLTWTGSSFESNSKFARYRIITTGVPNRTDSTTQNTKDITGLTNGLSYTFSVMTVRDDGALSVPATITWGPTDRYYTVRIYEFDSPHTSGLEFSSGDTLHFTSTGTDNRPYIDLWIDGHSGTECLMKSPSAYLGTTGWRTTKFATKSASSLDEIVDIPAASTFSIASLSISTTTVYFAITEDGNYARFVTHGGVQGTAPNRYIDVDIAYNSGNGAWAKIPR